ncbi:MAG: pentapeptide repeat-containing protein [Bacteroidota bacterium]
MQQESSKGGTATIADNRPSTVHQRQLQAAMRNSPRVTQLREMQAMMSNSLRVQSHAPLRETTNAHAIGKVLTIPRKTNNTGLPDKLKTGMEHLSGFSMDDVKVHYNSSKPVQINAHAYAQGTDIYLGPGQEKHLPHELGHVVQQKKGVVKPTKLLQGKVKVNDDAGLEKEADEMGARAMQEGDTEASHVIPVYTALGGQPPVVQGYFYHGDISFESKQNLKNYLSHSLHGILPDDYIWKLTHLLHNHQRNRRRHDRDDHRHISNKYRRDMNLALILDTVRKHIHKGHFLEPGKMLEKIIKAEAKAHVENNLNLDDFTNFFDGQNQQNQQNAPNRQISHNDFIRRLRENEREFNDLDLTQVDFTLIPAGLLRSRDRELQFSEVEFKGDFTNVNFGWATFTRCTFSDATFINTTFDDGVLTGVEFIDVNFDTQTSFKNTIIDSLSISYIYRVVMKNQNAYFPTGYRTQVNLEGARIVYNEEDMGSYAHGRSRTGNYFLHVFRGRSLKKVNLSGANLSGTDLTNADLTDANLSGTDLTNADLTNANLIGANLYGATFTDNTTLTNVTLTGTILGLKGFNKLRAIGHKDFSQMKLDLTGANLNGKNLTGVNLTGATLTGATFTGATLNGVTLDVEGFNVLRARGRTNFSQMNLEFSNTNFNSFDFTRVVLGRVNFTNAILTGANFTNVNLNGANLTNVNLNGANLTNVGLTGVTLDKNAFDQLCGMGYTNFSQMNLEFSGANFNGFNFTGLALGRVNFTNADLTGANLANVNLNSATFTGATLDMGGFNALLAIGHTNFSRINVDLTGANLTGMNFTGMNLTGVNLTNANLTNTNFTRATLGLEGFNALRVAGHTDFSQMNLEFSGANFNGFDFTGLALGRVNFINADLTGANLANVNLNRATFTGATLDLGGFNALRAIRYTDFSQINLDLTGEDLTGMNFTGMNLTGVNLTNANLTNTNFTRATLDLEGFNALCVAEYTDFSQMNLEFSGANFNSFDFTGLVLGSVNFTGATLTDARFNGMNLSEANFNGATFTGVDLTNAILTGVNLDSSRFTDVTLTGANLQNAYLRHIQLQGALVLEQADLTGAKLQNTNLTEANLRRANLTDATLTNATLTEANLHRATLTDATLTNANLTRADLRLATLTNANLTNANLTEAILRGVDLRRVTIDEENRRVASQAGAITRALFRLRGTPYGYRPWFFR